MDEIYTTQDIGLASFLCMNRLNCDGVRFVEGSKGICEFVFNCSPEDKKLQFLLKKWSFDPEVKPLKRILYNNKVLKKALKDFLTEQHNKTIDEEMF